MSEKLFYIFSLLYSGQVSVSPSVIPHNGIFYENYLLTVVFNLACKFNVILKKTKRLYGGRKYIVSVII